MKFKDAWLGFYDSGKLHLAFDEDVELETKEEEKKFKKSPWLWSLSNLVTPKYESADDVHRGLHYSAGKEEFTVSAFMGMGWIDIGYEFAKKLAKDDPELLALVEAKKTRSAWVPKEGI
jgi:hypothetical protein